MSHTVPFSSFVENISSMLNLSDLLTYLMAWQNGQTNLRFLLSAGDGRFSFDCTLLGFWDTGISLQPSGDFNSIDLNLVGYDFEFLDESAANIPREESRHTPSMCADSELIAVPVKRCSFWRLQRAESRPVTL